MLALRRRAPNTAKDARSGAYLVEFSLVIPVFAVMMVGLMEFAHAYLVVTTLGTASRIGARMGAVEGITSAQVRQRVLTVLSRSFDSTGATVMIKDASIFDTNPNAADEIDYTDLPETELNTLARRKLFIVRVEVPYDEVALLPPFWVQGATLSGQSVMRHE
ncbi:MAG: pilus assembly protein [Planctomycetaceae bacterium]|nr:pilus assembly protein [Planctomycetaceae bacterium]